MLLAVLFVICASSIVIKIIVRLKNKAVLNKIKHMDETDKIPIFGSAHLFIGKLPEDVFKELMNQLKRIGSPAKTWIMSKLIVTVRYSEDIQRVLSSPFCYEKGSGYELFSLKNSLISAKPKLWRVHRKLLNSSFHIGLLNNFVQQFNEVSKGLVADLNCKAGETLFDIEPYFGYRMIDLQLKTNFDADIGEKGTRVIFENNKIVLEYWGEKLLKFYTHFIFGFIMKLFKVEQFEQKILNNSFTHIKPIIDNARTKYYEKLKIDNGKKESEEDVKNKPELFIHKLVKLVHERYLTEQQMRDHIDTMLLAGGDTLTVSISNCILCLAMNPEAQDNCVNEINEILGYNCESLNLDDLTKLNLLDRTINECLRLIPTVPLIVRVNEKDIELSNNKVIPAGTDILIPIALVHHCNEYWGENPTKFNPDNFLPENVTKRPLLSYIPYSYGLRNCIARKYSYNALKIVVAHLVMNYKFSTDLTYEQLRLAFGITTIVRNKHMVRIEKR